mgnify:CR=1 FL=1
MTPELVRGNKNLSWGFHDNLNFGGCHVYSSYHFRSIVGLCSAFFSGELVLAVLSSWDVAQISQQVVLEEDHTERLQISL